jgi:hypothetical protein
MPCRCGQVGAAHNALAIKNEVLQQIEHLRLKRDAASQFATIRVE